MARYDVTIDSVDAKVGRLTGDLATRILLARHSPLARYGSDMVSMFYRENVSGWIGLALMGQESSYGIDHSRNKDDPAIDDRNIANPFSAHFTKPKAGQSAAEKRPS